MALAQFHMPDPSKEAKKAIDRVIKPAVDAGKAAIQSSQKHATDAVWKVRHDGWDVLSKLKNEGEQALHDAQHDALAAISTSADEAEKAVHAAGDRAVEAFTEDLPKALHDLWQGLQSVVAGKVGDVLFGIAGNIAPGHATVGLLFFEFQMQIKEQLPVLRKWIAAPPTSGDDVKKMLMDLAGDGYVIFRPAKIPGLPYLGLDPRIPVKVEDVPKILDQVKEKMEDIL